MSLAGRTDDVRNTRIRGFNTVWSRAIVQTCVIHVLRNTFRYASRKYRDQIAKDIRPVYTAATEAATKERFTDLTDKWGAQYPAITQLWEHAWSEFVPFLNYDVEIRRVICSTNAVESLKARYRLAIRARGHFPTEQAAMKCLYLVTRSLDPTRPRQGTMGNEVEARTQCVRDHLQRPDHSDWQLTNAKSDPPFI